MISFFSFCPILFVGLFLGIILCFLLPLSGLFQSVMAIYSRRDTEARRAIANNGLSGKRWHWVASVGGQSNSWIICNSMFCKYILLVCYNRSAVAVIIFYSCSQMRIFSHEMFSCFTDNITWPKLAKWVPKKRRSIDIVVAQLAQWDTKSKQ